MTLKPVPNEPADTVLSLPEVHKLVTFQLSPHLSTVGQRKSPPLAGLGGDGQCSNKRQKSKYNID